MLELPERDRATLIGRLHTSERGQVLAEVLADVETDSGNLVRLRLITALGKVLG